MNDWVLQDELFGLGNFINLTPTIQLMARHFNKPVQVYFELDFVRQCFLDCDFIEILDKRPDSLPLFSSGMIDARNKSPDYIYVYKQVTKRYPLSGELPHTYIDRCEEIEAKQYSTVFIRGAGNGDLYYRGLKLPHADYYHEYLKGRCAFTGSSADASYLDGLFTWRKDDKIGYELPMYLDNVRESLALIREAKYVVANDSGLAHAAAAMRKDMTILWKNTSLPKNANPNKNCVYKMCHD